MVSDDSDEMPGKPGPPDGTECHSIKQMLRRVQPAKRRNVEKIGVLPIVEAIEATMSLRKSPAHHLCLCLLIAAGRLAQGASFTTFDVPRAVAGYYLDAASAHHGFLRAPNGAITTFDAPGASMAPYQGTFAVTINSAGVIAGTYVDANNLLLIHRFVRSPDGTITSFDGPGATLTNRPASTEANSINATGGITGVFIDLSGVQHGFARPPDGAFLTFDAPGAGKVYGQGTFPESIDTAGSITGIYTGQQSLPGHRRLEHQRNGRDRGVLCRCEQCLSRPAARHQRQAHHFRSSRAAGIMASCARHEL